MNQEQLVKRLADLGGGNDPTIDAFIRTAAKRAFWFTSLLITSGGFVLVVSVIQAIGIRPWERGWETNVAIAAFVAAAVGMIVSIVAWSIRHMEFHRATQALIKRLNEGQPDA